MKLYYSTKKRIIEFVKSTQKRHKELINLNLFDKELDFTISELGEYPKENRNQLHFYKSVQKHIKTLTN